MSGLASWALLGTLLVQLLLGSTAAEAQVPQDLEQLEPGRDELQLEYQGLFAPVKKRGSPHSHSMSINYGVSDRLTLGMELEGEQRAAKLGAESLGLSALVRVIAPRDGALNLGVKITAEVDKRGRLNEAQVRMIAERIVAGWWLQGNIIAQHGRDEGNRSTTLSYVSNASRNLASNIWLGLEISGGMTSLHSTQEIEKGHFIGPSTSVDFAVSKKSEVEIGVVYLARIAGTGPANSIRAFVQIEFD